MTEKLKGQLTMAFASILLGFLLVIQFQAHSRQENIELKSGNLQDLSSTLIQAEMANENLAIELNTQQETLNKYQAGESTKQIIKEELHNTKLQAGLIPVTGPGVEIILADSPRASTTDRNDNTNDYLIHDYYLRDIVNILWNAGAEAICINNNRVISTSEIFCGGSIIFINRNNLSTPFVIKAIGDPNTLTYAVNTFSSYRSLKGSQFGIRANLKVNRNVYIPQLNTGDLPEFKYAEIIKE
jgi:uncharacterized protein YlxW (UPF0749 family)